ncbi:DUF748 domain-containing protein [Desulfosediminicola sp.]|uniref:DUF748 domain-containing protein n=1 Tax=Desulfosediminicola sp. TaxID=2886825 RepID=UPI003AF2FB8F
MSDRFGSIPIEPEPTGLTPSSRASKKPRQRKKLSAPAEKLKKPGARKEEPKRKLPKLLVTTIVAICIFCSYLAAGFWGVPKYIRGSAAVKFHQKTGMLIDFEQVAFNPLSFVLDLSGIDVIDGGIHTAGDDNKPLLTVSSFSATLVPLQLLRGELVTTSLAIDNLDLHLVRHIDGNYNISPPKANNELETTEEILDFSDLPFRFSLNNISVQHSRILFEDKPKKGSHVIENIDLTLPNLSNFSFAAKEYIRPSFHAVVNGSPIEMTGQAIISGDDTSEMHTNLECNFADIDLPLYLGYLPIELPFDIAQGRADASLNLTFSPTAKDNKLLVNFSIQAEDTSIISKDQSYSLVIPSSKLEGGIQPITGDTHLKNVVLRQPELRLKSSVTIEDAVAAISAVSNVKQDAPATYPATQSKLDIDLLLADSGSLLFLDNNNKPLAKSWTGVQVSLKDYSNTAPITETNTASSFRLMAEGSDKKSSFKWQGKLNHANFPDGQLHLTGVHAPWILNMLGLNTIGAHQGTADTQAHISFSKGLEEKDKPRLQIADASLTLRDFSAKQGKTVWYSSPDTQITGFSKDGSRISLGSIVTQDGSVHINTRKLPAIISSLDRKETATSLDALDFSGSIVVENGSSSQPQLQFSDARLQTIRLSQDAGGETRDNSNFTAKLKGGGHIQAKGHVQLQPFSARYTTQFGDLPSTSILPWFGNGSFVNNINAMVSGAGELQLPKTHFNGQLSLDRGSLGTKDSRKFSWDKAQFEKFQYHASPLKISAAELFVDGPEFSLTQSYGDKQSLARLHSYIQSDIAKPLYKAAGKQKDALQIGKIRVADAKVSYADTRLSPVWKGEFSAVNGTIQAINSGRNGKPSLFSFSGKLDSIPFKHEGALALFASAMNGDSTFSIADLPLPSFHEQISNQIDIDTSSGLVNVTETTTWKNGTMEQKSEMIFRDVEPLSEIADSALTLALISNDENQFTLTAENSQPDSSKPLNLYSDAVFSLKRMMVKASVSPLLLASGNFSDLVGNEHADFLPGEIILSGQGRESLTRFSNLLASHPYIGITVTGVADPNVDGKELKEALEKLESQRVAEENRKRSEQLDRETEEYLRKAAEARIAAGNTGQVIEEDLPVHLFSKYAPIEPEPIVIDESMLRQLADQRAKVIATFFVENLALDESRIKINNQSQISQNEILPGNRVQFSIEPYTQQKSRQ